MNKKTLTLILAISISYMSSLAFAEEPFIGIGVVNHTYKQDPAGTDNDAKAEPSSYKITLGSRVAKKFIIEAYYLVPNESDEIIIGGNPTVMKVEYETLVGASINYALVSGPFTFYIGPNVTAAKIKAESSNPALDAANDLDIRVSPGAGAGIDLQIYKKISLAIHGESYLQDGDRTGIGAGAELRYHF